MVNRFICWLLVASIFAMLIGDTATPTTISVALLGDIMLGRGVAEKHNGSDWNSTFAEIVPLLQSADLTIANLESPLSTTSTGSLNLTTQKDYNLCAPAESILALQAAGLDILTLANNHTQDCSGNAGDQETAQILQQAGLKSVEGNYTPILLHVNNLELAVFAMDDVSNPLDVETAVQAVHNAKQQGSIIIVSIHWGMEYHPGTDRRQQFIAQELANAGAAVIAGHHPHVLQKIEWIQGTSYSPPTLVAYSLGNALFDQTMPDTRRSVVLLANLNSYGVVSWWVAPFQVDYHSASIVALEAESIPIICSRLGGKPGCDLQNQFLKYPPEFWQTLE